jgi:hypothetical protein
LHFIVLYVHEVIFRLFYIAIHPFPLVIVLIGDILIFLSPSCSMHWKQAARKADYQTARSFS